MLIDCSALALRVRSLGYWLCGFVAHHRPVHLRAHLRYVRALPLGVSAFCVDCLAVFFEAGFVVNIMFVVLV